MTQRELHIWGAHEAEGAWGIFTFYMARAYLNEYNLTMTFIVEQ